MPRWHRTRALIVATAVLLACVATTAAGTAVRARTAGGLTATFVKASEWSGGFVGGYTIRNTGSAAVSGWRVEFDLPAGAAVTNAWNATVTAAANRVSAVNVDDNGTVPAGGSVEFGFQASGNGGPASCTVNGGPCGGGGGIGEVRTIADDLRLPWGVAFLPGGSALVSERNSAAIIRVTPDGQKTTVGTVPGAVPGGEGGLMGLALSPGFASDRLVYAYFTAASDNRIVRMTYNTAGQLGAPQTVLTGIPKAAIHDGGRIAFGPDGMLYAGTGDAGQGANAQNMGSLGGKILRMTPTGQPAPGNPFPGSVVFSLGHRNVQGLAFDSLGRLWASEFGQNTADELNLIRPGGNYGWPTCEGRCGRAGFVDPVFQWATTEASPSGIAIVNDVVYMASLRGSRLWRIPIAGDGVQTPVAFLAGTFGRLRTAVRTPDGNLWLTTSNLDGRGTPRPGDDRIVLVQLT
jgi:aldose sugar dehydrogenase